MSNPTAAEKKYHDDLCNIVGCIACRINGIFNTYVSIHHIDGRMKPWAQQNVLPLCGYHHQLGTPDDPSVHPWKARFVKRYGTEMELKAMCDKILEQHKQNT